MERLRAEAHLGGTVRSDEGYSGEIGRDPSRISRQERPSADGRVCSDQEVGENGFARSASTPVVGVRVTGEQCRGERDLLDHSHRWECRSKRLDAFKARRDLRNNDRVED